MDDSKIFITGANGQLGTALRLKYPNAKYADISDLDITNRESVKSYDWSNIEILINAAAYTNVDGAETPEGRVAAWNVNSSAVGNLANIAEKHNITLIHISTDYVFDGSNDPHTESEPLSPLSVYGASKAAGDLLVTQLSKYYLIRTSWVIGEGKNFVRTMLGLGEKGVSPSVVSDQIGRLTFTNELIRAIDYLLINNSNFGVYNLSNSGKSVSWADVTRKVYELADYTDLKVTDITTEEYYSGKTGIAPRPFKSTLSLDKIQDLGFESEDWETALERYVNKELEK